ncbi:hypothetical protein [Stenotrophomonas maltophilia]|uniref:hypothetical protein n=1 Tax=Stenotrophomonas maltophilia TaxID=40324 RepID=UPI000A6627A5|nr:hypothetical protein [Stenotrophomonas maltophilia]
MLSSSSNALPQLDQRGQDAIRGHSLLLSLGLAVLAYLLITRIVTPGFFEPLVPTHSDTWRYFAYSKTDFSASDFTAPRPLMLVALKLMGAVDSVPAFVLLVLLPAFLLPVILLKSAQIVLERRVTWPWQFVYYAICYSLPSFYELQTLDFGGCLSGWFACATLLSLRRLALQLQRQSSFAAWATPLLLAWISMECKPTYGMVLAALPVVFLARMGWRRTGMLVCGISLVVLAVLVKDRLLGSPFVGSNVSETSSYYVASGVGVMWESLMFYLSHMVPLGAGLLVLIGIVALARRHGVWCALMFVAFALLAIAPMLAIPNNKLSMYGWFGASILFLPVAFLSTGPFGRSRVLRGLSVLVLGAVILLAFNAIARAEPSLRYWYGFNQKANKQSLLAIEAMRPLLRPGQHLLVAGPLNAFNPFRNDEFIALQFPYALEWTVLVPELDTPLLPFSDSRRHIASRDLVDIRDIDVIAMIDAQGRLANFVDAEAYRSLGKSELINSLFCRQGRTADTEAELNCLRQLKEVTAAAELSATVPKD